MGWWQSPDQNPRPSDVAGNITRLATSPCPHPNDPTGTVINAQNTNIYKITAVK